MNEVDAARKFRENDQAKCGKYDSKGFTSPEIGVILIAGKG